MRQVRNWRTLGGSLFSHVSGMEQRLRKTRMVKKNAVGNAALAPVTDALRRKAVGLSDF